MYGTDGADRKASTFGLIDTLCTAVRIDGIGIKIVDVDGIVGALTDADPAGNTVCGNPTGHDYSNYNGAGTHHPTNM